jgi:hypothetical protein
MTKPLMSAADMPSLLIILAKFAARQTRIGWCGRRRSQAHTSITAEHFRSRDNSRLSANVLSGRRQYWMQALPEIRQRQR